MSVPITGNLTETQRFPAPLSGRGRTAGGPIRQPAPDIRQSKAAGAGEAECAEEEAFLPKGSRLPGMPSSSTSLTRTTGRPRKKCIEYSPHMEQQHGLLVVDKPRGLSSAQCTNRFKRLGQKKIGHAGTLDPMAQGVLLVLLGHATKISGYLMAGGVKAYQGTVRLGQTTDTWDADGQDYRRSAVGPCDRRSRGRRHRRLGGHE